MRRTASLFGAFCPFSLAGGSPPASKRTKIPRKSKAVRCEAVLPELKCSQTRKSPQRILCVFSRALTQYEGISARQNRVCPCQSTQNSMRLSWTFEEVDERLHNIMRGIYKAAYDASVEAGQPGNLVVGANIASFLKIADAMLHQGIV